MINSAETLQARYYEQSASDYDSVHNASEEHEHNLALQYIEMISNRSANLPRRGSRYWKGHLLSAGSGKGSARHRTSGGNDRKGQN